MAYKEIVTKAVIGKGKKNYKNDYQISVSEPPSTILGCWIINHNFKAGEANNLIRITGSYDINIWYAYENDTKTTVITKTIEYTEEEALTVKEKNIINKDIIIRCLKQPTCISAKEDGNTINIEIEKELGIEIVGDTKIKISSVDEEESWDNLEDNKKIDNINTEYIDKNIVK